MDRLSIINSAYGGLTGTQSLTSLDTPDGRVADAAFNLVLNDLIARYKWTFLIAAKQLNNYSELEDNIEFQFSYPLPSDMKRFITVLTGPISTELYFYAYNQSYINTMVNAFQRCGNVLLTNYNPVWAVILRFDPENDQDYANFNPGFSSALIKGIQAELAISVLQNMVLHDKYQQRYEYLIRVAVKEDSLQSKKYNLKNYSNFKVKSF